MRVKTGICLAAIAFASSLRAAAAQSPPPLLPRTDVTINYQVASNGQPDKNYRLEYQSASERARITALDPGPTQSFVFLVDVPAGRADLIMDATHTIIAMPDLAKLTALVSSPQGMRFTPLGHETIAGLACTKYLILSPRGSGTACLTRDGIALAVEGKDGRGSARVRALSVDEATLPAEDFTLPAGYSTLNLPPGMIAQMLGQ